MNHYNNDISETEFGASIGISHLLMDKAETLQTTNYCDLKFQHHPRERLRKNTPSLSTRKKFNWHFYTQCFCKAPKNLLSKMTAYIRRKK